MDSKAGENVGIGSNNPFRQVGSSTTPSTNILQKEQQQSLDSEKQVVSSEALSGPDNAPTPVGSEPFQVPLVATREADKEVISSWQTQSQEQSAPISMVYHESNSPSSPTSERFFNDVKGPPPAYDAISPQPSSSSSAGYAPLTTPTSLEPDSPGDLLPPRSEDKSAVGQLLAWIPPPPRTLQQPSRLAQPVIIPQLDVPPSRESVPFQRCYSDALAAHGVTIQDFTRFLDGLEVAQLPNSTLQGLRMFGVGISHVPIPILGALTGKGLQALAGSGSGHSGSRARFYLEQAKERYFKPRGLRVTLIKDDDLIPRLQIPSYAPRLGMLTHNNLSATCCQRRMEALGPYTAPLRFGVPDQDKQIQGVQKMARKHLNSRFKEKARWIDDLRRQQPDHSPVAEGSWEESYRSKLSELRDAQYDLILEANQPGWHEKGSAFETKRQEVLRKQRELQLVISERQNQGKDDLAVAAEMEEVAWTRRLKWLVIESA